MGGSVGAGVETGVDLGMQAGPRAPVLRIALLGPLSLWRAGEPVTLPASRKVRALLAWLAMTPRGASRAFLCELLWDAPGDPPGDPRGELRWCLSKLRRLVDDAAHVRVIAQGERVRLDLSGCEVDAPALQRAAAGGVDTLSCEAAAALAGSFGGDFLEGMALSRSPAFTGWLSATRRSLAQLRIGLLRRAAQGGGGGALTFVEQWLQLSPFDMQAHALLLRMLAGAGRGGDAQRHVDAAARRFADEGFDFMPVHREWAALRAQARAASAALRIDSSAGVPAAVPAHDGARAGDPARRGSIAVLAFDDAQSQPGGVADALVHDVITRLARLRNLFVIAPGSVFALRSRGLGAREAAQVLGVDYLVTGAVRSAGTNVGVSVELTHAPSSRLVWSERYERGRGEALAVLGALGDGIVASIAGEIERIERDRAILRPPDSLDAWEAHHRGLWHMYRFTRTDNDAARHFFGRAVRLDPTFARAWAGLSFTHWQGAFQGWEAREAGIGRALDAAGRGIMADERDPAVHWAQGRALWLRGAHEQSVAELSQAVELSPNFALGHYALAFVQSQAGDARAAVAAAERSRTLSPFDPLLFGILGARAMALVRLGRLEEAAAAATQAAGRPNAHAHIYAIAACTLALADRDEDARTHAAAVQAATPGYGVADFLRAFRFDPEGEARFREGARRAGLR